MPAISERVARWVRGLGFVVLLATIATAIGRRWGHPATVSTLEVAGGGLGVVFTAYGSACCVWWRRDRRRREREEFERLISKGKSQYSGDGP